MGQVTEYFIYLSISFIQSIGDDAKPCHLFYTQDRKFNFLFQLFLPWLESLILSYC